MPPSIRYASHDQYFAAQPPAVQAVLQQIQHQVEARLPEAVRCIGYNMPAYRHGKIFFYFAAFKKHIGIYPPVTVDQKLIERLAPFRGPKGNLSFPLAKPLPYELIGDVAEALDGQYRSNGLPRNEAAK
ncbi:MAG: hypothetical protein H6R13_2688 [Proteobacteria bacterium]|nr:hypothetical protein [Pseudomonadota bacterium]